MVMSIINLTEFRQSCRKKTVIPGTDMAIELVLLTSKNMLIANTQAVKYIEDRPELTAGGDIGAQLINNAFILQYAIRTADGSDMPLAESAEEILDVLTPHQVFALTAEHNEFSHSTFTLDALDEKELETIKKFLRAHPLNEIDGASLKLLKHFLLTLPQEQ